MHTKSLFIAEETYTCLPLIVFIVARIRWKQSARTRTRVLVQSTPTQRAYASSIRSSRKVKHPAAASPGSPRVIKKRRQKSRCSPPPLLPCVRRRPQRRRARTAVSSCVSFIPGEDPPPHPSFAPSRADSIEKPAGSLCCWEIMAVRIVNKVIGLPRRVPGPQRSRDDVSEVPA